MSLLNSSSGIHAALYRNKKRMRKIQVLFLALFIALSCSCTNKHLISNKEYLDLVDKSFNERKELAKNRGEALFKVFDRNLSLKQQEALRFLYAFMPLNDLADYSGDFFLANVDMSLKAK